MPPSALPNAPNQTSVAADLNEARAATVAVNPKAAKARAAKARAAKARAGRARAAKVNSELVAKDREMAAREEARGNAQGSLQVLAINRAISVELAAVGVAVVLVEARVAVADNSVVAHAVDVSARVAGANPASQLS